MSKTLRSSQNTVILMPKFGSKEYVTIKNEASAPPPVVILKPQSTKSHIVKKIPAPQKKALNNVVVHQSIKSLSDPLSLHAAESVAISNKKQRPQNESSEYLSSEIDASSSESEFETSVKSAIKPARAITSKNNLENSSNFISIQKSKEHPDVAISAQKKRSNSVEDSKTSKLIKKSKPIAEKSKKNAMERSESIEKAITGMKINKKTVNLPSPPSSTLGSAQSAALSSTSSSFHHPSSTDKSKNASNNAARSTEVSRGVDILQNTELFLTKTLDRKKENDNVLGLVSKKFEEYKDASDKRRREQEAQLNAYSKEIFTKTRLLSMFEQITNVTIESTGQFMYKWIQKGDCGTFEGFLQYCPDEALYHYTPKVLPPSIDRMDEAYQAFKKEMFFDSTQLGLFYNRISNIIDFDDKKQ